MENWKEGSAFPDFHLPNVVMRAEGWSEMALPFNFKMVSTSKRAFANINYLGKPLVNNVPVQSVDTKVPLEKKDL